MPMTDALRNQLQKSTSVFRSFNSLSSRWIDALNNTPNALAISLELELFLIPAPATTRRDDDDFFS
jgi:hypothetical protein